MIDLQQTEKKDRGPLYQMVVFCGYKAEDCIILCPRGDALEREMEDVSAVSLTDLGMFPAPDSDGLWVWQGHMSTRRIDDHASGGYDYETIYKGFFRRLTPQELKLFLEEGDAFYDRRSPMDFFMDGLWKAEELKDTLDWELEQQSMLDEQYHTPLHVVLGMTEEEYARYAADPGCIETLAFERRAKASDIPT